MKAKKILMAGLFTVLLCGTAMANGQQDAGSGSEWPKKAIQIICPFAPGGDTDFNARSYTEGLKKALGVDVVIVSTEGNGGATGARKAKDVSPDGYSVFFGSSAFLTNELSGAIDFGLEAFEMSCVAGENPGLVICVRKELGVKNLKELVNYTAANPGRLRMAANTGATTQIVALMLKNIGVNANIVDAGDSGGRIVALLGGHVDIIINAYGSIKDYVASGDFVALGIPSDTQPKLVPDIPTCISQGYNVVFPSYYFFAFPKGTDKVIVDKFTAAVGDIAKNDSAYAKTIADAYS
ncbi:MAG: tripartite tricarboxylate transporter substrate binding protein, partial [Treponema sp.]|nr:tripartite tricarboxylate transporter substrate binding protein [Treponema sp.]